MMAVAMSYLHPDTHRQPPEVRHANQIDRWGTLPNGGGLDDEPIGYLDRCAWASFTQRAFSGRGGANNIIQWIDANPGLYDHYAYVTKIIALTDDGWTPENAMRVADLIVDEENPLKESAAKAQVRKENKKRGN